MYLYINVYNVYYIYTLVLTYKYVIYIYTHKFIHIYKFDSGQEGDSVGETVTKFSN